MKELNESYVLQEAISSRPRLPLTHNQLRRLESIDLYHKELFTKMDVDIKYKLDHEEWEKRQVELKK